MNYAFDPELASIVPLLPSIDLSDVEAARAAVQSIMASSPEPDLRGVEISDFRAPVPDGTEVRVRVFRPEGRSPEPAALLSIHGGGFVSGSIDFELGAAAGLVRELGITIVSVDYRLAPEHPYPAALDDCMAALHWLHRQTDTLGIDPARIGVYGQSAGGGLAAAVALRCRDEGGPPLCFQFLGIPELDDRLDTPSMRAFVDTPMWNRANAELSWKHYFGALAGGDVPVYAAPARASDLANLPPAYVNAMEFDPLRDEAIDYATRMLHAGVAVELHVYPGTFHGSSAITTASVSRRIHIESVEAIRRGLAPSSITPLSL
jgi:acetyl esterase